MLSGFLIILVFALAYGLLYVIYGKKGLELRKEQGKRNTLILLGLAFVLIFWFLLVMFLIGGMTGDDMILCIAVAVIVPVFIAIWAIIARNNVKNTLVQDLKHTKSED